MGATPEKNDETDETGESKLDTFIEQAIEVEMETGQREKTVEKAKRHLIVRIAIIVAGTFLVLLGLVFFLIPGPGLLTVAAGLALLSVDVPFARRLLEKVRKRLPEGEDGQVKPWVIIVSVAGTVVFTAGSLWWTFGRN